MRLSCEPVRLRKEVHINTINDPSPHQESGHEFRESEQVGNLESEQAVYLLTEETKHNPNPQLIQVSNQSTI